MTDMAYPFHISDRRRTAEASPDDHIRQMLEQLLFTIPGERVNRPTFGTGLLQLVFAPNGDELAAATQFLVQGAVQKWMGDVLLVEAVDIQQAEATLIIRIQYVVRRTQERQLAQFERSVAG